MVEIDNFDAENVAPQTPFELLAPGWYCMQFIESVIKSMTFIAEIIGST